MYHIDLKKDKPDIGYMQCKVSELMKRGIRLADCNKIKNYYISLRDKLKENFTESYGVQNPNSPKQIVTYLQVLSSRFDINSKNDIINICYDSENKKWTTDAESMEKLADLGYEFAKDLLDYRHAKKYAESIQSITEAADENGLVHPEVTLSKTNRINYANPGLLTIPKKLLWHLITPYKDGNILYSVDIKNQEPSILINMTGADELKYALESDEGLYETMFKQCFVPTATANVLVDTFPEDRVYSYAEIRKIGTVSPAMYSAAKARVSGYMLNGKRIIEIETICLGGTKGVYPKLPNTVKVELEDGTIAEVGVEWESADKKYTKSSDYSLDGRLLGVEIEVSKAERNEFKRAYLALSYGASSFGIDAMCKIIDGKRVYQYVTGISAIKNYRKQIKDYAKNGRNIICTVFGTRLFAGEIYESKKLERTLMNIPIQGSGADIVSLLLRHFYDYTSCNAISDKMSVYYTRHDELIIEVDKDWYNSVGREKVESILKDMLEHQINDWTPFKIEISQTKAASIGIEFEDE